MKPITHEWFSRATDDLATAQVLLSHEHLTNMVAFHAQQGVEKALKAVIEELDLGLVKTHSLIRLYGMIRPRYPGSPLANPSRCGYNSLACGVET